MNGRSRRETPLWAECHLEPELNAPEEALDLIEKAHDVELEFFSVPLDVDC